MLLLSIFLLTGCCSVLYTDAAIVSIYPLSVLNLQAAEGEQIICSSLSYSLKVKSLLRCQTSLIFKRHLFIIVVFMQTFIMVM